MCNDQKKEQELKDYRFIIYRLDQLEGEEKENFKQIMKTLQIMQEGLNEQNKTLIELNTRMFTVEDKIRCIDKLKEVATEHHTEIKNIHRRLNIYKVALSGIAVTIIGAAALHVIGMV